MNESAIERDDHAAFYQPGHPTLVEDEEGSIDVFRLLQTLRNGKGTILKISLAFLAIAVALAFLLPVRYTSVASFIPPSGSGGSSAASAVAGQLAALGAGDILGGGKNSGDLYAGILQSRSVTGALVKNFDLMRVYRVKKESQAERLLASNTIVGVDVKSSIVTVSVTDTNPQLAQDLANGYMSALRTTDGRLALSQSSQRRLFFEQQLAKEKDDLEDAEVDLKRTEERSGLIAPVGQTESEIRTIAETQAQMALRQVQLAALRQSRTDQNPDVVRLRSEIDDLQGQLQRLQSGNGKGSASIPTSKVPELQLDYVRKEREVKYHESLFEALSKQYESARLDEAHDAPILQVLDSASYPDTKTSPKRTYILLGGLFLGVLVSSTWVLIRDRVSALRASQMANASI